MSKQKGDESAFGVAAGSAKTPEPQADENLAICPYCGKAYQVESEDYTEYDVEEECERCGKTYMRCTYFSVTHHTRPLPNTKATNSGAEKS